MTDSFIETYLEAQTGSRAPEIFSRWAAISCIASILQRKTWVVSSGTPVYPSMIIALIGPPGGGKSSALSPARAILNKLYPKHISAQAMTKESIIKEMADNHITYRDADGRPQSYSPFIGVTGELNVLLKPGDVEMLNVLNNLWDCEESFVYKTKNADPLVITNPFLSLIGGATTRGLANILPQDAYASGFTARIILVYCNTKVSSAPKLAVDGDSEDPILQHKTSYRKRLSRIADRIHRLGGAFAFQPAAAEFLTEWYEGGCQPELADSRFEIYNDRRFLHVLKLAMIISADKATDMIITVDHVSEALVTLFDAEKVMPDAAAFVTENTQQDTIQRLIKYVRINSANNKGLFATTDLNKFLSSFVKPKDQYEILQQLAKQGYGQFSKATNGVGTFQLYPQFCIKPKPIQAPEEDA